MESLVNMMQAMVKVTFSEYDYINDYDVFTKLKQQTGSILKYSLRRTDHLSGLYVTFNPDLHTGMEEVWYAYKNGEVTAISDGSGALVGVRPLGFLVKYWNVLPPMDKMRSPMAR